jgi:rhodanese-related sulfurtransferase
MFSRPAIHEIDPADLSTHARARIIDVREPHELAGELGHLPGAELVPLATLEAAAAGWNRDQPLILVCRSGGRSARATTLLVALGFRGAINLRGGMLAVHAAGLPVARISA